MKLIDKILTNLVTNFFTKKLEKMLGKSWKTSVGGIGSIAAGIGSFLLVIGQAVIALTDGNDATVFSLTESKELIVIAIGSISAGIALLKARDSDVSTEEAAAK